MQSKLTLQFGVINKISMYFFFFFFDIYVDNLVYCYKKLFFVKLNDFFYEKTC